MKPFNYVQALDVRSAVQAIAARPDAHFIGGGTNLVDLMKYGVEQPTELIDISRLPLTQIEALPDGGLRIGALVRNTDLANHSLIRENYPVLTEALLAGASAQLRNAATTGGNLLQRTRCYYFYDVGFTECNKRIPGSGCAARDGVNRIHAILGASDHCIATNPSDMCVAMSALGATVRVESKSGGRTIPFAEFHRLPGHTPQTDTNLKKDELIVAVDLPAMAEGWKSSYVKVRDRNSYAFALVSAAALLNLTDGKIREARFALGGVAHKPWRVTAAEQTLSGQTPSPEVFAKAADVALHGAVTYPGNAFKVQLTKKTIIRAFSNAAGKGQA